MVLLICPATEMMMTDELSPKQESLLKFDFLDNFFFLARKPQVSILKSEEQPISGSSLTLRCQVRGYPVPVITWFKDQMRLNEDDRVSIHSDGELSIKGLYSEDNGMYTCEASNDLGVVRKQVEIKIQELVTEASVTGN